jgi:hypothetical protein
MSTDYNNSKNAIISSIEAGSIIATRPNLENIVRAQSP